MAARPRRQENTKHAKHKTCSCSKRQRVWLRAPQRQMTPSPQLRNPKCAVTSKDLITKGCQAMFASAAIMKAAPLKLVARYVNVPESSPFACARDAAGELDDKLNSLVGEPCASNVGCNDKPQSRTCPEPDSTFRTLTRMPVSTRFRFVPRVHRTRGRAFWNGLACADGVSARCQCCPKKPHRLSTTIQHAEHHFAHGTVSIHSGTGAKRKCPVDPEQLAQKIAFWEPAYPTPLQTRRSYPKPVYMQSTRFWALCSPPNTTQLPQKPALTFEWNPDYVNDPRNSEVITGSCQP